MRDLSTSLKHTIPANCHKLWTSSRTSVRKTQCNQVNARWTTQTNTFFNWKLGRFKIKAGKTTSPPWGNFQVLDSWISSRLTQLGHLSGEKKTLKPAQVDKNRRFSNYNSKYSLINFTNQNNHVCSSDIQDCEYGN